MTDFFGANEWSKVDLSSLSKVEQEKYVPKPDSEINYGAISRNLDGHGPEKFYLTTAIAYTNGYPHVGHAYEFLTADVLVRYHRVLGYDTYFLTGYVLALLSLIH